MDRAGADHDEETAIRVGIVKNGDGFIAAREDGGSGAGGLGIRLADAVEKRWRGRRLTWGISCWRKSGGVRGL